MPGLAPGIVVFATLHRHCEVPQADEATSIREDMPSWSEVASARSAPRNDGEDQPVAVRVSTA
jgi:hypothetical protein